MSKEVSRFLKMLEILIMEMIENKNPFTISKKTIRKIKNAERFAKVGKFFRKR